MPNISNAIMKVKKSFRQGNYLLFCLPRFPIPENSLPPEPVTIGKSTEGYPVAWLPASQSLSV